MHALPDAWLMPSPAATLHAQDEDGEWQLLYAMGGERALDDALLASPELAASAVYNVLAAAAAQCNPAERPENAVPALMATSFVAIALSSLATQQPLQRSAPWVAGIAGLPAFLAACVQQAASLDNIACTNDCLWLLEMVTLWLPAGSPQR